MFAIFGRSKKRALELVDKRLADPMSKISKDITKGDKSKGELLEVDLKATFNRLKPSQISGFVSTPEIAKELFEQYEKDANFDRLVIKAQVKFKDDNHKIKTKWVELSEMENGYEPVK